MMMRTPWLGGRLRIPAGLCVAALAASAQAEVRLPALFGDHVVLQQQTEAPIWGWAEPGERIAVRADWLDDPIISAADENGRWKLSLPTPEAGGPYTLTIEAENVITLTDVMIGEVWICSGQSNMEMPVDYVGPGYWGVTDYEQEIAAADYPQIRLFTVQRALDTEPRDDCTGQWRRCSPDTAGEFSAVGYFFGRDLHEELDVPIGLICTAWGGTPAEAWTSYEALQMLPDWAAALRDVDRLRADPDAFEDEYQAALASWRRACRQADPGLRGEWMKVSLDDSTWKTMDVPGVWRSDELGGFDGVVWFRRSVEVPDGWAQRPLVLELGPIDDWDVTWFNGQRIGAHDSGYAWQTERRYDVLASMVRGGRNVITVRVIDTGGAGGIYGSADQLKLHPADDGDDDDGEAIGLAGPWRYAIGAPMADLPPSPRKKTFHAGSPGALYNGMIAPLLPYAIRGAIWYQGESNRYDPAGYRTLFPAMIRCWRDAWGRGDFPFYFVQIAPFDYTLHGQKPSDDTARLREAQLMTLSLPETGMAVTMDVGNPRDIHPRDKRPVGERLARWAKAKIYGRDDLVFSGPLYRSMKIEGDRVRLYFDFIGSGLVARGGELTHFTIAGEDGIFVPARAMIDGQTVIVFSEQVSRPAAVRYAWADAPDPNLFNRQGLPASPFRTDVGQD